MHHQGIRKGSQALVAATLLLSGCHVSTQSITPKDQYSNTLGTLKTILDAQQKPSEQLSLSEAIARTLKYNLDHRVSVAQTALESSNFKLAMMQMIPKINASMDYSFRDNALIQNLVQNGQVVTGQTSTTPRYILQNGYEVELSTLDFGLSYVRAKQQSKRALISEEQRRKITQQLVQESTTAYWQAFTAQRMGAKVSNYKMKVETALARSKRISQDQTRSNQIELDYQQVLIKSIRRANALQRDIGNAKVELSRLMNVHPQAKYTLKEPSYKLQKLPAIKPQLIKMDTLALVSRPELREASYNKLIRKYGIEAAVMSVLPDLNFDYGWNQTNNMFLKNQAWAGGNVNIAWNILKAVLMGPQEIASANYAVEFEKIKQAANTLSVLTQIRVALVNYNLWREDFNYALQELKVSNQLLSHAQNLESAQQGNEQVTIRRGIEKLNAEFDAGITHAKAQEALFKLYQSIGIDIMPSYASLLSLNELTQLVGNVLDTTAKGGFNQSVEARYQALLPTLGSPNVKKVLTKGKSFYKVVSPIKLVNAGVLSDNVKKTLVTENKTLIMPIKKAMGMKSRS